MGTKPEGSYNQTMLGLKDWVYSKEDIKSHTDLGLTHIVDITSENGFIRTPLGGFINHSETPNLQVVIQTNGNYHIKTLFNIRQVMS